MTLTVQAIVVASAEVHSRFWNIDVESGTLIRRRHTVDYSYIVGKKEYGAHFDSPEPYSPGELFNLVVDPVHPERVAICGVDRTPIQWAMRTVGFTLVAALTIYLCFHFGLPTR